MEITVSIVPNSKKSEIIKVSENNYRIRVDAPASKNKANKRLVEILSEHFKVSKSSISIIKGFKSRNKIIRIEA
jgi:uncharacterized protein (TIGR00251 family)